MPTSEWIALPENRLAKAAMTRVARALLAQKSPTRHNPLFLHGPTGTGKSRLVSLLVAALTAPHQDDTPTPTLRIDVLPAKDLALEEGRTLTTEQSDTSDLADLVVIEDVQHLPKRATERMASLVDRCLSKRRQLVVTSLVGPALLRELPGRLTSRLGGGLVVGLQSLSETSRRLFLQQRAQQHRLALDEAGIAWLAQNLAGSCRELEGALARLRTLAKLETPLNAETLRQTFAVEQQRHRLTLDRLIASVGQVFGVSPAQMRSTSRLRRVLLPRQVAMYLARCLTDYSLHEIAEGLGRSDHTTVLHACRKVAQMLPEDVALEANVRQLEAELGRSSNVNVRTERKSA